MFVDLCLVIPLGFEPVTHTLKVYFAFYQLSYGIFYFLVNLPVFSVIEAAKVIGYEDKAKAVDLKKNYEYFTVTLLFWQPPHPLSRSRASASNKPTPLQSQTVRAIR